MSKALRTGQKPGTFKPGDRGNPGGRPKLTADEKKLQKLTKPMVAKLLTETCGMTRTDMERAAQEPNTTAIKILFIKAVLDGLDPKGDAVKACEFILNRTVGKVKEEIEMHLPVPTIIEYPDGSQTLLGSKMENEDE